MELRDKWFWTFVLKLIKEKEYQLVDFQANKKKEQADPSNLIPTSHPSPALPHTYLLKNEGRSFHLIRLQAVDAVWNATLTKDIRSLADQANTLKKRLRAKELSILNLYIFPFAKDEYLLEPIENLNVLTEDKTTIINNAIFLDLNSGNVAWGLEKIDLTRFGLDAQTPQKIELPKLEWISLEEIQAEIRTEEKRKEKEFFSIFHYGKPIFTYLILLVNLLIFLWVEWQGSSTDPETLIRFGAKWSPAILAGEYWRLITPMFLHIGIVHLLMNSLALYYLGNLVEKIYGSGRFILLYLFAGFTGTVASFIFSPTISAGASGAIFGCFGALLYFGLHHRNLFYRTLGNDVIIVLAFNLFIGFVFPMIDNYGHIGGLVGGFLAAMMLNLPSKKRRLDRTLGIVLALILVGIGLWAGFTNQKEHADALIIQATLELNQENFTEARDLLERAIELGDDRPEVLLQTGAVYNQLKQFEDAEQILHRALKQDYDEPELYFQLAYAQLHLGKMEEGEKNLLETIYRNPMIVEAYYNLALIYAEQEKYQEALEVLDQAKAKNLEDERMDDLYQRIDELYKKLQELD